MSVVNRDHWERLQSLFDRIVAGRPDQRRELLEKLCGGDGVLRQDLEALLNAHQDAHEILPWPVDPCAAQGIGSTQQQGTHPEQIGQYVIQRCIAAGGMGIVYEAIQRQPQRTVAVKLMRCSFASPSSTERFRYESELLARLKHPNVAQVYHVGVHEHELGSTPFFAMEFVEGGQAVTEYADKEDLSDSERLKLFADVCDAVHHAHQNGVIHRDLKPSNILVDSEGHAKIIDFGVARSLIAEDDGKSPRTETGQLLGTLQYMSPEQCAGRTGAVDARSDIYSLGVVVFELLCHRLPYDVEKLPIPDAVRVICDEHAIAWDKSDSHLPGDLGNIVGKTLEKDPDRRYRSASELADDIRRYLNGEAVLAHPASIRYKLRVFGRRHKAAVASAALVILLLVVGIVASNVGLVLVRRERDTANEVTAIFSDALMMADPYRGGTADVPLTNALDEIGAKLEQESTLRMAPLVRARLHRRLGKTYDSLARFDKAVLHLRTALAIRKSVHGSRHAEVAESLNDLAIALRWTNLSDDPAELLREALDMRMELLGPSHPDTLQTVNDLGVQLRDVGEFDEAESLLRNALDTRKQVLGSDAAETAVSNTELGVCLLWCARRKEAESCLREAVESLRRSRGEDHPYLSYALRSLSSCLTDRDEAVQMAEEAVAIERSSLGGHHNYLSNSLHHLGSLYFRQGRFADARDQFEKALAIRAAVAASETSSGADPTLAEKSAADSGISLSRCLIRLENYTEAENHLLRITRNRKKGWNEYSRNRLLRAFTELYEAWGKPEKAAKWQAKLSSSTDTSGPDLPPSAPKK